MLRYETLLLARTEMTDDDSSNIERQIDKLVSDVKGKLSSFDKWGKFKLSYSVNKNTHGLYMLARYEIPDTQAATVLLEIDRFLQIKCNEIVMRHVSVRLDANAPATYQRPDAMDAARGASSLDNNKIENLLSSVEPSKGGKGRIVDIDEDDLMGQDD